jgi:hypothetical protein
VDHHLRSDPITFLILVNVFLLMVGCFMETIAAITILTPVLLPVAIKLGIDPVHFGLIMVLNLMIGLLTPPVGMVLYVLARVARISFEDAVRACAPWLIPLLLVLLLITFVPRRCCGSPAPSKNSVIFRNFSQMNAPVKPRPAPSASTRTTTSPSPSTSSSRAIRPRASPPASASCAATRWP